MSSQLGFRTAQVPFSTGAPSRGNSTSVVKWVEQPLCSGAGPSKPRAEDSSLVTVQIQPTFIGTFPGGSSLVDAVAFISWSAARQAQMMAEVDLLPGTSFQVAANNVNVDVGLQWSVAAPAATFIIDATIGRMPKSIGAIGPTRTKSLGLTGAGAFSTAVTIPPYAKSFTVVSSDATAFAYEVAQTSNGVIVEYDTQGTVGTVNSVSHRADSISVKNGALVGVNLFVVFRIGL